jgi:hypothetical protein
MYTSTTTMNTTFIILLMSAVSAMAQVVTLVSPYNGTNNYADLVIEPYQTAELLSIFALESASLLVVKDGTTGYNSFGNQASGFRFHPVVVAGPAVLQLTRGTQPGSSNMATFRLTPEPYPVGSALLVPPGPGGASVALECSTNLVDWSPAPNGVYTNQPVAKFFRIRLDKIPATP